MRVNLPFDFMSEQTSDYLAERLQQNWMNRHMDKPSSQSQGAEHDDSLTNLNWLQDINLNNFAAEIPISPPPNHPLNSTLFSSLTKQTPKSFSFSEAPQTHTGLSPICNSSQSTPQLSAIGTFARFREDYVHNKRVIGTRNHAGLPHTRCNKPSQTHRLINNRFLTPNHLEVSSDQLTHLALPTANILRTNAVRSPLLMPYSTTNVYTLEQGQLHKYIDNQACGNRTTLSNIITNPAPKVYTTAFTSNTNVNVSTGNLPLFSYPCSELLTYPSSELFLVKSKSVMADRTNYPAIVRSHNVSVQPPMFTRSELPRSITSMSVASDLVDVTDSGLFVTIDTIDPVKLKEYQNEPNICPPFSFHNLIYMSMNCMKRQKVTLSDICAWIMENFAYYRMTTNTNWQEILRESLTTCRCFQRVQRRKEEPRGKGDLWRLNPEFQAQLENNKVSPKFLSAWQNSVNYSISNGAVSLCTDHLNNTNEFVEDNTHDRQSPLLLSPKCLPRYPSLEELTMEEQELFGGFKKRKRSECYTKPTLYSDGSSINDTASSCASSSSPPLSDLCTPPPPRHNISETDQFSSNQLPHPIDSCMNIQIAASEMHSEQIHTLGVRELGKNTLDLSCGISYLDKERTEMLTTQTDQSVTINHELSEMDAFFQTVMLDPSDRLPDEETVNEFTQTCGLQGQISLFDVPMIVDPIDLTIRGVGLKPLHDWWSNQLPESIPEVFTESLGIITDSNHLLPEKVESVAVSPATSSTHKHTIPECTTNTSSMVYEPIATSTSSQEVLSMVAPNLNAVIRSTSSPNSPLSVGIEQQWIDEQLNLEELDSLLGLS